MATYYVDGEYGNDLNNGLSPQTAWKTINKAVQSTTEGDVIYIKPWVYDLNYGNSSGFFYNPPSGTTWIGDVKGEKWGVKGNVYIVSGYVNTAGSSTSLMVFDVPSKNITFKNFYFVCPFRDFFSIKTECSNFVFENCSFGRLAWGFGYSYGTLNNIVFRNCYFEGIGGLIYTFHDNIVFENCVIRGMGLEWSWLRWTTNWKFKNCIILARIVWRYEGGYPASLEIDRSYIRHDVLGDTPLGRNTTYTTVFVKNSIITTRMYHSSHKYDIRRCVNTFTNFGGLAGNFIDIIGGTAFPDLITNPENILKNKSLNYNLLFYPSAMKNFFSDAFYYWQYYKPITITNNDNIDYTDVQVKLVIDTASLVSAGKLRDFCEDLRFTLEDGTIIPHWIEYGENTSNTIIWVKIPSLPANESVTIRMYYGNNSCPRRSDGYNVFEFFDHFCYRTDNYAKWHVITGANTFSETYGLYQSPAPVWPGELGIDSVFYQAPVSKWFKIDRPCIIEAKARQAGAFGSYAMGLMFWVKTGYSDFNRAAYHSFTNGSNAMLRYCDAAGNMINYTGDAYTFSLNTKYINQLILTSTQVQGRWLNENREFLAGAPSTPLENTDWMTGYIVIDTYVTGVSGNWAYFDWVIVRKYMASEPTISIGDEVSGLFAVEGEPDLKDFYDRDPVEGKDLGALETEYPPELGIKKHRREV